MYKTVKADHGHSHSHWTEGWFIPASPEGEGEGRKGALLRHRSPPGMVHPTIVALPTGPSPLFSSSHITHLPSVFGAATGGAGGASLLWSRRQTVALIPALLLAAVQIEVTSHHSSSFTIPLLFSPLVWCPEELLLHTTCLFECPALVFDQFKEHKLTTKSLVVFVSMTSCLILTSISFHFLAHFCPNLSKPVITLVSVVCGACCYFPHWPSWGSWGLIANESSFYC